MKNKEHSRLQKDLNYKITEIVYYLDECKSTKKLLGKLYNKSYKNPDNAGLTKHKQRELSNLLFYRRRLSSLQQQVITMKHQIKQSQRDNQELNS